MITTLALSALTLSLTAAPTSAPMRLLTDHGVELRADEDVFLLFAALNAAGYAEESERKGPPLRAPVFHAVREDVRDAIREAAKKREVSAAIKEASKLFESNPGEIEDYLAAILAPDEGAKLTKEVATLRTKLTAILGKLRETAELAALFDKLAEDQRNHSKALKTAIEKDFADTAKLLGVESVRAPVDLVVVPNPLDAHASVRSLSVGNTRYLVVGPGFPTARRTILEASLRPLMTEWVSKSYGGARSFAKIWDGLKTSKRITSRWPTGDVYLASALTSAVAYRVRSEGAANRETDEEFIDEEGKNGMRWARVALKILDSKDPSVGLGDELPKLLGKISP